MKAAGVGPERHVTLHYTCSQQHVGGEENGGMLSFEDWYTGEVATAEQSDQEDGDEARAIHEGVLVFPLTGKVVFLPTQRDLATGCLCGWTP